MSKCALAQLEASSRVIKRAQYEAFEFELQNTGVLVRNHSHENPSEHEYLVTLRDGIPSSCECPANACFEGACKHRVAVAIRKPILEAATSQELVADGGPTTESSTASNPGFSEASEDESKTDSSRVDCDCSGLSGEFPCWECYRNGRKELP
ncbi:SWIM zinc finger family protein [Halobacterium wangiae]|uniref:SWIM zinc finger family protein n=1 Tax=Halobacterium wangiae TaxID=2902623 RepID=UPI0032C46363